MREYRNAYAQYYTEGTAARKVVQPEYIRPERRQEELPEYAKVRKAKTQKGLKVAMNPAFAVFLAFSVLATLTACTMMLSMQAKVTNQSDTISMLQSEIETLTDENNVYENRLNSNVNLEQIRETAINQLGMVYPTEGQVVYYNLTEADYVRQYQDVPSAR
ncbi:MAG: hypothetical protein J6B50_10825 [Lachnospiraceae bacterium]|nr:hypothetical protein [Lachnospiraceae bacterium]